MANTNPIKNRIVGEFNLQYLGQEDDDKNEKKLTLSFACEIYFSTNQGGRLYSPIEAAPFGTSWKAKMLVDEFKKNYKQLLEANQLYKAKAAIDVFSIGTNSGVWFEILAIQPIQLQSSEVFHHLEQLVES